LLVTAMSDRQEVTVDSDSGQRKNTAVTENSPLSLILPKVKSDRTSAFAQYSIRVQNRDDIQKKLSPSTDTVTKIPTAVHYPMPLQHLQECFAYLGYKEGDFPIAEQVSNEIMSLPMNPYLTNEEIAYIAKKVIACSD